MQLGRGVFRAAFCVAQNPAAILIVWSAFVSVVIGETHTNLLQGSSSPWKDFVDTLPQTTNSPTLWPPEEQSEYLQGSPALQEAQARSKALDAEWDSISQQMAADPSQQTDREQPCHSCSSQHASNVLNHTVLHCNLHRA